VIARRDPVAIQVKSIREALLNSEGNQNIVAEAVAGLTTQSTTQSLDEREEEKEREVVDDTCACVCGVFEKQPAYSLVVAGNLYRKARKPYRTGMSNTFSVSYVRWSFVW
jgi:hypothetical protein